MKRIPRPVLRALEALAQSPINTSALAMAEGQGFAHDTLYRALGQPLAFFFELSLKLCRDLGGLERGYLILDDVLIQRYRSGRLGLRKMRDTATGGWAYGLSLVVLAWTDGKRRIPLAFLPYFGEEESKLDLALALLVAVGVFPNEGSLANLATVVLLRVTEGWAFRRYMDMAPLWAAEEKPTKIAA